MAFGLTNSKMVCGTVPWRRFSASFAFSRFGGREGMVPGRVPVPASQRAGPPDANAEHGALLPVSRLASKYSHVSRVSCPTHGGMVPVRRHRMRSEGGVQHCRKPRGAR